MRHSSKEDSPFPIFRKQYKIGFSILAVLTFLLFIRILSLQRNPTTYPTPCPRNSEIASTDALSTENNSDVLALFKSWEETFGLSSPLPPDEVRQVPWLPPAPHLQMCNRLFSKYKDLEKYDSNRTPPYWSRDLPKLPWVRGDDASNLPHTRFMQAKIWMHQFPVNCKDPSLKFGLFHWVPPGESGLGSSLHLFSQHLAEAINENRIFVAHKGSFSRARGRHCRGDKYASLNCYFAALTSPECEARAWKLWKDKKAHAKGIVKGFDHIPRARESFATMGLEKPWEEGPITVEIFGEIAKIVADSGNSKKQNGMQNKEMPSEVVRTSWWHAQAIRFLLRWPTPYMCHIVNKVRHEAYGLRTAKMVLESRQALNEVQDRAMSMDASDLMAFQNVQSSSGFQPTLERELWWEEPPYLPHPIISMHVRQGDKKTEMETFSLATHMWLAERIRGHVPNIQHIWLSTEMQTVIDEVKDYDRWNFLYTQNKRQVGEMTMADYTKLVGTQELTELSFANLLVAVDCDYFVGSLGSNWNRLINELRSTGGKLKSGMAVVNVDDV